MTPQTQNKPQSIHEVFTFYLSPAHVEGHPRTVTVKSVTADMIYNAQAKKELPAIVLHFTDARRSLKLNKTQAEAMWTITGTDDFHKWTGHKIHLATAPAGNGKMTIKISKPNESESKQ